MGELSPWHLLILAAVFIMLFGAKRLPDAARSLGKSMRIFKAETQSLRGDHADDASTVTAAQQAPVAPPQPLRPPADDGTTVNGVPISEVQRNKQPS